MLEEVSLHLCLTQAISVRQIGDPHHIEQVQRLGVGAEVLIHLEAASGIALVDCQRNKLALQRDYVVRVCIEAVVACNVIFCLDVVELFRKSMPARSALLSEGKVPSTELEIFTEPFTPIKGMRTGGPAINSSVRLHPG